MKAYDPRAIANLMLDEADQDGIEITNLALQKLLYFAHGLYLTKTKQPLVSGYFEAWQYGPVHPAAYALIDGTIVSVHQKAAGAKGGLKITPSDARGGLTTALQHMLVCARVDQNCGAGRCAG